MHETTSPRLVTDCRVVSKLLGTIGDRWTMQVIVTLRPQALRFNELKRSVGGISQQMLVRTLKALERDGMVARTVGDTSPPSVSYALTALGESLSEPARRLAEWARDNSPAIERHRALYDQSGR